MKVEEAKNGSKCNQFIILMPSHFSHSQFRLREACLPGFEWISGKFPNGLWPPPRPFFGKFHCDFFRKPVAPALNLQWNFSDRKWPPPFLKFFWKFMTKKAVSNAKKIAMKFFRSEMTPPLFWSFSGNSFESGETGFPYTYNVLMI